MANYRNKNYSRKRVLIVEDNKMHSELLKIIIQSSFGAGVVIAENGREAQDLIADGRPFDLITIDIMIPEVNGLDLLKTIRKVYAKTPVLMISALGDRETIARSIEEGATDFIIKPIQNALLKDKINILLKNCA